jgi:hypothetical protein
MKGPSVDVLAEPAMLVAYGIHQKTGEPYFWLDDTPCDTPLDKLPAVTAVQVRACLLKICDTMQEALGFPRPAANDNRRQSRRRPPMDSVAIVRNAKGIVIDGREGF